MQDKWRISGETDTEVDKVIVLDDGKVCWFGMQVIFIHIKKGI